MGLCEAPHNFEDMGSGTLDTEHEVSYFRESRTETVEGHEKNDAGVSKQ